jgi:hypothetical protein
MKGVKAEQAQHCPPIATPHLPCWRAEVVEPGARAGGADNPEIPRDEIRCRGGGGELRAEAYSSPAPSGRGYWEDLGWARKYLRPYRERRGSDKPLKRAKARKGKVQRGHRCRFADWLTRVLKW